MPALVRRCPFRSRILATLLLAAAWPSCSRGKRSEVQPPDQELDAALRPATLVSGLRRVAGAHFHATSTFRVNASGGPDAGAKDSITTTTDLWIDKQGNFRLAESNDQDGGREVVRVAGELAVALRYGKFIRRPAQDPEPQRFLEEGVGAPSAAWDIVRRFVEVVPAGSRGFRLSKAAEPRAELAASTPLRKWRETVDVQSLVGDAQLDASGGLQTFSLASHFRAVRDGTPIEGELAVAASVDAAVAPVIMPVAETLPARQRTILEERALLGGLGGRIAALPSSPKTSGGRRSAGAAGPGQDKSKQPRQPSPAKAPAASKQGVP